MDGTALRIAKFIVAFFVVPVILSAVFYLLIELTPPSGRDVPPGATVEDEINVHMLINLLAVWICPVVSWIAGPLAYGANRRLGGGRHRVLYYVAVGGLTACILGLAILGPGFLTMLLLPYDPVFLFDSLLWFGHAALIGAVYAVTVRFALEWFDLIGPWNPRPAV
jgi:hypothetical protein